MKLSAVAAHELGRCPDCGAVEGVRVLSIVGWRLSRGKVVSEEIGARFACQRCPCIYSVGPSGVFRQNYASFPLTPIPVAPNVRGPITDGRGEFVPRDPEPLIPRLRPAP